MQKYCLLCSLKDCVINKRLSFVLFYLCPLSLFSIPIFPSIDPDKTWMALGSTRFSTQMTVTPTFPHLSGRREVMAPSRTEELKFCPKISTPSVMHFASLNHSWAYRNTKVQRPNWLQICLGQGLICARTCRNRIWHLDF